MPPAKELKRKSFSGSMYRKDPQKKYYCISILSSLVCIHNYSFVVQDIYKISRKDRRTDMAKLYGLLGNRDKGHRRN